MALNKAMMAVVIAVLVATAAAVGPKDGYDSPRDCYCPCMTESCMTKPEVTKEICASACDQGCREAGYSGQPNQYEFCGF